LSNSLFKSETTPISSIIPVNILLSVYLVKFATSKLQTKVINFNE
jgi:hypothetical protein